MGTCVSSDFVASQERINSEFRQELSRAREASQAFQNALMEPRSKEELETLRQKINVEREIKELRELISLRNEVDSLKQTLRLDPNILSMDMQKEVQQLKDQLLLMKDVKNVTGSLVSYPPCASLTSMGGNNIANWNVAHCKEGCFDVYGQSVLVIQAGYYLIHLEIVYNGSFMSSTSYTVCVNSVFLASSTQTEGGNTHVMTYVALERESIITVRSTIKFTHVTARLNIVMLKG